MWGDTGRLVIAHEGLDIFSFPKTDHRSVQNNYEINLDKMVKIKTDASYALFNLYQQVYEDILINKAYKPNSYDKLFYK